MIKLIHDKNLLTMVESTLADLLTYGIISTRSDRGSDPVKTLRSEIGAVCKELLPEAIGLTDAFGFTDWELNKCVSTCFLS